MAKTIVFDGTKIHEMMDLLEKSAGIARCKCGAAIPEGTQLCLDCLEEEYDLKECACGMLIAREAVMCKECAEDEFGVGQTTH